MFWDVSPFFVLFFGDIFSRSFVVPDLMNTDSSEIDLKDMKFPLDIKICPQPGFNKTAIGEAGYDEKSWWSYFKGVGRFNSSIVGWAGHTRDGGVQGSVEDVYHKIRGHKIEDVIQGIEIDFETEDSIDYPLKDATFTRVNYPHNCYTLDLSKVVEKQNEIIKILRIKARNIEKLQISLYGSTINTHREIYDNTFYAKGDTVNAKSGELNKYAVKISKNIFLEDDKSKNCREYPNSEYASYMDCDNQYVKKICDKAKLAPIWLLEDISLATTYALVNDSGK